MAEILSVEVGDEFGSIGTSTTLKVVKIWFEYSLADERWETSVTWKVEAKFQASHLLSGKGRDFVKTLRDGAFVRVNKKDEDYSFSATAAPSSPPATTVTTPSATVDPKRQQWEIAFRKNAARYGLAPTDLGRRVVLKGIKSRYYTIVGARPQNWKMPILVEGKRGGVYKITAEKARAGLV